jgi:hypothetical protein
MTLDGRSLTEGRRDRVGGWQRVQLHLLARGGGSGRHKAQSLFLVCCVSRSPSIFRLSILFSVHDFVLLSSSRCSYLGSWSTVAGRDSPVSSKAVCTLAAANLNLQRRLSVRLDSVTLDVLPFLIAARAAYCYYFFTQALRFLSSSRDTSAVLDMIDTRRG